MIPITLTKDGLGITTDYRDVLKDFSELYNKFDSLSWELLINPNLNHSFWGKMISNWIRYDQAEQVILSVNQKKLFNFEENLDVDWLNLQQRDYNYQWRLHSFDFCSGLIAAYEKKQDKQYLNIIFCLLASWQKCFIEDHHPEEIFPWNDHATANRLLVLTHLFYFLNQQPYIDAKQINELKNIILIHIFVLSCRNFYSFHTNHGMFQANHAYIASTLFNYKVFDIDWRRINLERLKEEFNFSFTYESVHKENSPEYHLMVFKNFLHFNNTLKELDDSSSEIIPNMSNFIAGSLKFLAYSIKPNGLLPTIGDTEEKPLQDLSYLASYTNYDYFLYAFSKGLKGKKLPNIACAFAEAGYFFIKSNYDDIPYEDQFYLAAKSGFLSKYHRQNDDCSCIIYAYGEDWLIDGGLYRHEHHDPIREYMRSHYSHNLLMPSKVDIERDIPPSDTKKNKWGILEWLTVKNYVEARLGTNMYEGFSYERSFCYHSPYEIQITDRIRKLKREDNSSYYLAFHIPKDKKITVSETILGVNVESDKAMMTLSLDVSGKPIQTNILINDALPTNFIQKVSKRYNTLENCQTVIFEFVVPRDSELLDVKTDIVIKQKKILKRRCLY